MKSNSYKHIILTILLCIIVFFSLYFVIKNHTDDIADSLKYYNQNTTKQQIILNCTNLTTIETARCLRNNVLEFFNYNYSNLGRKMDFETLKEEGGVCYHYTKLYNELAGKLGFNTERVIINTERQTVSLHEFLIISNSDAYCLMDMGWIKCVTFLNDTVKPKDI